MVSMVTKHYEHIKWHISFVPFEIQCGYIYPVMVFINCLLCYVFLGEITIQSPYGRYLLILIKLHLCVSKPCAHVGLFVEDKS